MRINLPRFVCTQLVHNEFVSCDEWYASSYQLPSCILDRCSTKCLNDHLLEFSFAVAWIINCEWQGASKLGPSAAGTQISGQTFLQIATHSQGYFDKVAFPPAVTTIDHRNSNTSTVLVD